MKDSPTEFENKNVHEFYSNYSTLFSSTRYATWPGIRQYLQNIDSRSCLVLDSGCGNGRNMQNGMFGVDYGINLLLEIQKKNNIQLYDNNMCEPIKDKCIRDLDIIKNNTKSKCIEKEIKKSDKENLCRLKDVKLFRCTTLNHPFKNNTFDHILSIAVIHHFATKERRICALKDLYRILKLKGSVLVYVWSRHVRSQSKFIKVDKECGENNDYKVIWGKDPNKIRYYYLYDIEELSRDCVSAGFKIEKIEIEHESIFAILKKE